MGEVLHEVDFNQLKIENSQYLEKIDERNQDLLRLKLMATNVLQILNTYKVKTTFWLIAGIMICIYTLNHKVFTTITSCFYKYEKVFFLILIQCQIYHLTFD